MMTLAEMDKSDVTFRIERGSDGVEHSVMFINDNRYIRDGERPPSERSVWVELRDVYQDGIVWSVMIACAFLGFIMSCMK